MCQYIVEQQVLRENVRKICMLAQDVPVWAVLKGNGYGLGLLKMARLVSQEGIRRLCVGELREARKLRQAGFSGERILMLQPTTDPETLDALLELDVICTVSSWEDAKALEMAAIRCNRQAEAHIKIDTGMGRYGFLPEELDQITAVYEKQEQIRFTGIYTHFSDAISSYEKTRQQYCRFHYLVDALIDQGIRPGEVHCCNSAAFLQYPQMRMDSVRIGSAFLGRMPYMQRFGLQRVGYCEARVEELHTVEKGERVGYGGVWRAGRRTRLAIIPVGWYHGFTAEYQRDSFRLRDCLRGCLGWLRSWLMHRRVWVEIDGRRCPVCGHVGMLSAAVDVTDHPCSIGDSVRISISPVEQRGMKVVWQ